MAGMHWSLVDLGSQKTRNKKTGERSGLKKGGGLQTYSDWMLLAKKQEEGWKQGVIGLESIFGFL